MAFFQNFFEKSYYRPTDAAYVAFVLLAIGGSLYSDTLLPLFWCAVLGAITHTFHTPLKNLNKVWHTTIYWLYGMLAVFLTVLMRSHFKQKPFFLFLFLVTFVFIFLHIWLSKHATFLKKSFFLKKVFFWIFASVYGCLLTFALTLCMPYGQIIGHKTQPLSIECGFCHVSLRHADLLTVLLVGFWPLARILDGFYKTLITIALLLFIVCVNERFFQGTFSFVLGLALAGLTFWKKSLGSLLGMACITSTFVFMPFLLKISFFVCVIEKLFKRVGAHLIVHWQEMLVFIERHFIWGWGVGSSTLMSKKCMLKPLHFPHNMALELWGDGGFFSILSFSILLGGGFWHLSFLKKDTPFLVGGLMTLAFISFFRYPFFHPPLWLMIGVGSLVFHTLILQLRTP